MSTHKRSAGRNPATAVQVTLRWLGSFDPFGPYAP